MNTLRLTRNALLTGIALIIFTVELHLPSLSPIPGIKLGLSNIITVYALFSLGPCDALMILFSRILLGSVLSGNLSALIYSLSGGLLAYVSLLGLRKLLSMNQLWAAGAIAAVFHNLGQIALAALITHTPGLFAYLPVLMISGITAGLFTGLCTQYLCTALKKTKAQKT